MTGSIDAARWAAALPNLCNDRERCRTTIHELYAGPAVLLNEDDKISVQAMESSLRSAFRVPSTMRDGDSSGDTPVAAQVEREYMTAGSRTETGINDEE